MRATFWGGSAGVLWLLGGAARPKGEAYSPGAELRIAGVGPLVSLLLGGLFTLGAWLLHLASVYGIVVEMVAWLAGIDVLLAVFNAVPAARLDGGRLLRASGHSLPETGAEREVAVGGHQPKSRTHFRLALCVGVDTGCR
ncbi:site-2 protease family protein [Streptomyces sp. NPDC058316]|uniref:site-2 protease family protein n=1 Tax=unclassified Streptomyces TaxID=2593676 RepID=UPI003422DDB4